MIVLLPVVGLGDRHPSAATDLLPLVIESPVMIYSFYTALQIIYVTLCMYISSIDHSPSLTPSPSSRASLV